jgi:GH24 family phage-related lysozyme (muramidase)
MANPYQITFPDPVLGSLQVERGLSDLATARESRETSRVAQEASREATAAAQLARRSTGLKLAEYEAEEPIRKAERERLMRLDRPIAIPDELAGTAPGATLPGAAGLIAGFENFRASPYEDMTMRGGRQVSAGQRIGYGSDTITRPDGTVVRVAPGMQVSEEDARRDLIRRINTEFTPRATQAVGAETWATLPAQAQEALVSIAYNYGNLPPDVVAAAKTGDIGRIAAAVEGLANDNSGINRQRRLAEAAHIRSALTSNQAGAAPAQPQGRAIPDIPGMLGAAPMTLSSGGVPMTNVTPEGDLQPTTGAQAQAGLSQSGTAQTPGGATVQVPGVPGAPPMVDSSGFFPGTEPIPGGWQMVGPLAALQRGALALRTSTPQSPPVALPPAATTGGAMYAAPSQLTLGGSTAIVPAGFGGASSASTMAGGTDIPNAILGVPSAQQRQGLLPTTAQQEEQRRARATAQQPDIFTGLAITGPALQGLQQIEQQKAELRRAYARLQDAPRDERLALEGKLRAATSALVAQEQGYRAELAIGQLSTGDARPLNAMFQQLYGSQTGQLTSVQQNGRTVGYQFVGPDGRPTSRTLSPEELAISARSAFSATFRTQRAAQLAAEREVELEGLKEQLKQAAMARRELTLEEFKRKAPNFEFKELEGGRIAVLDKNKQRLAILSRPDRDAQGNRLTNPPWTMESVPLTDVVVK